MHTSNNTMAMILMHHRPQSISEEVRFKPFQGRTMVSTGNHIMCIVASLLTLFLGTIAIQTEYLF